MIIRKVFKFSFLVKRKAITFWLTLDAQNVGYHKKDETELFKIGDQLVYLEAMKAIKNRVNFVGWVSVKKEIIKCRKENNNRYNV